MGDGVTRRPRDRVCDRQAPRYQVLLLTEFSTRRYSSSAVSAASLSRLSHTNGPAKVIHVDIIRIRERWADGIHNNYISKF